MNEKNTSLSVLGFLVLDQKLEGDAQNLQMVYRRFTTISSNFVLPTT